MNTLPSAARRPQGTAWYVHNATLMLNRYLIQPDQANKAQPDAVPRRLRQCCAARGRGAAHAADVMSNTDAVTRLHAAPASLEAERANPALCWSSLGSRLLIQVDNPEQFADWPRQPILLARATALCHFDAAPELGLSESETFTELTRVHLLHPLSFPLVLMVDAVSALGRSSAPHYRAIMPASQPI